MEERLFFPATQNNRYFIRNMLSKVLPSNGSVLEIGSGSGEHGVIFQEFFPGIVWQTSDPEQMHRKSINAWINYHELTSIMPEPLNLDVNKRPWFLPKHIRSELKAVVSINMLHISPWKSAVNLFEESRILLKSNNLLILYGPFKRNGNHTSESNAMFDLSLKKKNSDWGLKDLEEVVNLGNCNQFAIENIIQMPANNLSLIFRLDCS